MKRLLLLLLVAAIGASAFYAFRKFSDAGIYRFEDVSGPSSTNRIAEAVPMQLGQYGKGGPNRLAVLVTDPASDWIGLIRAFKAQGIPATFTADSGAALKHQVVFAYPSISGRLVSGPAIRGLADHVRGGGTLLTFDLAGGGLEELFGISGQMPSRDRALIRWKGTAGPEEDRTTRFSSPRAEVKVGSIATTPTTAETLATFDDGSAAAVCRSIGGRACIIGVDPGALAQRAMNGRSELFSDASVDTYQPSMDVLFRWIRDLYVAGEDEPFLIGTAPTGTQGSLILTHDVDFTRSVQNSVAYADMIKRHGASATFTIQTKYVKDWNDDIFFNDANLPALKKVAASMEIASHSVAHSRGFKGFSLGSGDEQYPDYRPFVENRDSTRDATVFGELRVSKFLLENLLGAPVRSFRPGYLSHPESLPDALAATGYRYSSSLTANNAMTHLPFQLSHGRSSAGLLPVWEFPVTIQDEKTPALGARFGQSVALIDKIAKHGGVAVLLVHPDVTGHKLQFEDRLIAAMKQRLWIGSLGAFGDWWSARDKAEFDYEGGVLTVDAPSGLDRTSVMFPKGPRKEMPLTAIKGSRRIEVR